MTPTASSSGIPSVTVAYNHQNGKRRAVANVKLLVAAPVAGILPTPNAPDPTLDRGGVLWCISDTTEESIQFTDFDTESTEPSCMPLVYWSTQTNAAINLLRPEQSTNTVYLPYISTANAAATIIQHAYTKYINHVMPHHHHHVTTNAPTQLEDKFEAIMQAFNSRFEDILKNYKSIAKLDNYTNTATDNIVGDNRLLDDNG